MAVANDSTMCTVFSTPSDRKIVSTRVFDAPRSLVFETWTDPKHVPQWMLGLVYPSKDARDAAMQTGMMQGMNQSFDRAERYLQSLTSTRSAT